MKKLYTLLLVTLSFTVVFSQNDPNAKKILDGVSAKVKTYKGITAKFTIKSVTSKGKDNGTQTGTISVKGKKYTLKQTKREIICDGTFVYNYDMEGKTITKTSVDDKANTLTPENLLSNFYDKDFTYKLLSSAGSFYEIELIPIDKRKNFQKVNVFIDKEKSMITKAKILDKSNNVVEFTLSNLNTNATISDAAFVFDRSKYPKDVDILD